MPAAPLLGLPASAPVDLFMRPEQLELVETAAPCVSTGTVVARVYQGGHVDVYVACEEPPRGQLLLRSTRADAATRWPVGAPVGIAIVSNEGVAFAAT